MTEKLIEKAKSLRLNACAQHIEAVLDLANNENWPPLQIIGHLFDIEIESRKKSRIELRFKQSKLLEKPTIDQFDFDHHVSRKKQKNKILSLLPLTFIEQKTDIILIGNPGVGKSHLAKTIAYSATQNGIKTLFTSAMDMINHLISAEADRSLLKKLHYYQSQDFLVIDEIGYLPLSEQGSNLFFQVISKRHDSKSTLITTNRPFSEWGKIFNSTTVATAIADRLVSNSEILILEGESYRKKLQQQLNKNK